MSSDKSLYETIRVADENDQVGYTRHPCERYLQDHPDHVPTLIRCASTLISLAQYAAAKTALDHAHAIAPIERLHLVIAQRGHLKQAQGDFLEADRLYWQAHELDPEDATYLIYAGSNAFRMGNIDRGEALARQATTCTDGSVEEAWFNLGGYLLCAHRYTEAVDCYHRALEIDPEYELARHRLRDVELILKDIGEVDSWEQSC